MDQVCWAPCWAGAGDGVVILAVLEMIFNFCPWPFGPEAVSGQVFGAKNVTKTRVRRPLHNGRIRVSVTCLGPSVAALWLGKLLELVLGLEICHFGGLGGPGGPPRPPT